MAGSALETATLPQRSAIVARSALFPIVRRDECLSGMAHLEGMKNA